MPEFRVEVLAPGRRFLGFNEDGSKRYADFTPEYCEDMYRRNSALLAAGIPVPVSWDHRDDAKPGRRLSYDDWASERARGVAGHALRYELEPGKRVMGVINIPDDTDGRQAEKVRFCSPEIDYFTDGDGKNWGEVFTHIALTPRPRQHRQRPIARLSMLSNGPIRLAVDPTEGKDMADEAPKNDPPAGDGEAPSGAEAGLKAVVDALREKGMTIPDEVSSWEGLVIAIKASGPCDDDLDDDEEGEVGPVSGGQPVQMGHKAKDKQTAEAVGIARHNLGQRVNRLVKTGRVPPVVADELRKQLPKVRLSFTAEGDLQSNDLLVQIAAYERLPKNASFAASGRKRLGHDDDNVTAKEAPSWVTAEDRPDESAEARERRMKAFDAA
jgi:hypothetical protein